MRKTMDVRITAGTPDTNRDHGKLFRVTEMSAFAAERWAADALQGLSRSGVELPDDIKNAGTMAIASMGLKALGGIPSELFHDLMDRLFAGVTYYPDPARQEVSRGFDGISKMMDNDIEEIATILQLRMAAFTLQTGFSLADVKSLAAPKAPAQN